MAKRFLRKMTNFILERLAKVPNRRGIKFLLRLHDRIYSYALSAIKMNEGLSNGIHPKHWVTDFHNFFLDNIQESDRVLEVGCSHGQVSNRLAEKAAHVTAIDIRREAVERAKANFKRQNLEFKHIDFFQVNPKEKYDVIVMSNVLEHVDDRQKWLKAAGSLGKKLLIRVPAVDRDWLVPYKKELGLEWRLNADHRLEYTEDILRAELSRSGLIIAQTQCRWGNHCCVARTHADS